MNKKMLKLVSVLIILVLIAGLSLTSCSKKNEEKNVIKIGAILPLTGNLSFMGEEEKRGMELAQQDIDSVDISVVYMDSKAKPSYGVSALNKMLINNNIDAVIVSTTGVSRSVIPIVKNNGKIMSAFCMDPLIADKKNNIYRLYIGMEDESKCLIRYWIEQGLLKKDDNWACLYVNHPGAQIEVSEYLVPFFKENNKKLYVESYDIGEQDFRNIALRLKKEKITRLIIIGYGFSYKSIFKSLDEVGILDNLTIYGGWGFLVPNSLLPSFKYLNNVICAAPLTIVNKKSHKYIEFRREYFKNYGRYPTYDAALAYDNIFLLINILQGKSENVYYGVLGKEIIDDKGNLRIEMGIDSLKNIIDK